MNGIGISDESEATTKPDASKRKDRFDKIREGLAEQFAALGLGIYMVNQADGQVILEHSESLSKKLTDVAKQNKAVEKALQRYLQGSVYTALALEVGMIVQAIAKNHGVDPLARMLKRGQPEETSENRFIPGFPQSVPA